MSELSNQWSQSQKNAYAYIRKAVSEGITATAAVNEYRAGGGHIANDAWYSLFRETFSFYGTRNKIQQVPETYTVPETLFQPVDIDLREQYAIAVKVRGYSEELGQYVTRWATVESNINVTKQEWRAGVQQAISDTIGSAPIEVEEILEWDLMKRSR